MHSKTSILRSFFRPILRFLGMSTPPPPEFEFPGDSRVEDWESTLRDRYCSSDPEKSPRDRLRMETLKVTNIRRYKEKKHVEHEYLVAEVEDPVFGQPRYLLIERTVDDTLPANDTTARSPRSSRSALSLSSQSSLGMISKIPARDHVTKMASWPTGDILIDNIKCQGSKMILLHLAIAAKVVHDHNEKYHLFKRQCFWYTDVISGVLEKEFSLSKAKVSDTSLTADHAPDAEMERFDSLSGTYKKVKFYQRRIEVIDEIHAVFEAYRKNIETSVNLLNIGILLLTDHDHRS